MRAAYRAEEKAARTAYNDLPRESRAYRDAFDQLLLDAPLVRMAHWLNWLTTDAENARIAYRDAYEAPQWERDSLHDTLCVRQEAQSKLEATIARRFCQSLHDNPQDDTP